MSINNSNLDFLNEYFAYFLEINILILTQGNSRSLLKKKLFIEQTLFIWINTQNFTLKNKDIFLIPNFF